MAKIITVIQEERGRVQAAEVSADRKRLRILRLVSEIHDAEVLSSDALRLFLSEHSLHTENVVTAVPGDMLIMRRIHVPFRERAKIDKVIPFELEPLVPFPIAELEIAYRVLDRGREGCDLLVYALPREILDRRAALFAEAAIPLRRITVSALAAANTILHLPPGPEPMSFLHLHVAPGFSIFSLYQEGTLTHLQRLAWGERSYDQALGRITGRDPLSLLERSRDLSASDRARLAESLTAESPELPGQIRKALHRLAAAAPPWKTLYVTGGHPLLELLTPVLERALSLRVEVPDPRPAFAADSQAAAPAREFHAALGMALMEAGRDAPGCAFRRKSSSLLSRILESKRELRYAMILMAVLLCALFADFVVGLQAKEYRFQQLSKASRRIFQEAFPDEKNVINELEQMKLRIKEIEKQNVIFRSLFGQKPTPLEVLNELSTRIPEELDLSITDLTIDEKSIRFVGWTESFNAVNRIEQELKKSDRLGEVKVSNAKVGRDKSRVNFQIRIGFREP